MWQYHYHNHYHNLRQTECNFVHFYTSLRETKRVEKLWPSKARGISLPSFRNLFYVLASGAELERALFFLDVENIGVDVEEFRKVSSWVSGQELSDHVASVLFVLIDDTSKGRLFKEDTAKILFDWRTSRGFDKGSLQVSLGQLRI